MDKLEALRMRVSLFDETLADLNSEDEAKRTEAVLDAAALLTAAKAVVLAA